MTQAVPPQDFTCVPARSAEDVAAVAALFEAYRSLPELARVEGGFESGPDAIRSAYGEPAEMLLLARLRDGRPAGCAALRQLAPGTGELKRLYVAPTARGLGLGRALVDAVVAGARARGYRQLRLDSIPAFETAIALYRDMGFRPIPPYGSTKAEALVYLALEL